jgi:hypothetical protein
MSITLFNFAHGLPWITSLKSSNDDDHSDRLNHCYTVCFLLVCASIVTGSPFIFNRITCWVPAQFTGAYLSYTNNYCWISNTYYIPTNITIPNNKLDRKQAEIGYYQWTPFILLLAALGFYLPRILWRSLNTRSGINLEYLITKSNVNEIVHVIEHYCHVYEHKDHCFRSLLCTSGKHLGNYLRSLQLLVKFLYLINSLIQLILIHIILGQPGWFYGFDIWYNIFIKNSVLTDSPYFPRVTLCDLRIREIGNLHHYTVQCVLPINMLNEKVFSLAWFVFIYVFLSNLFSVLYETLRINHRMDFIRTEMKINEKFIREFLKQDGRLMLYLIHQNGHAFLAPEVLRDLYRNYQLREQSTSTSV